MAEAKQGEAAPKANKADTKASEGTANAEATPSVKKDIVPPQYRKAYAEHGGTCGDFIAGELSAMVESGGLDSLNTVKAENDIPKTLWANLNNGQQRMNLSNRLRASFLRGETIKIAGKEHNLNRLKDEFGKLDPTNDASVRKFLDFVQLDAGSDRNRRAIVKLYHTLPQKALAQAKREEEREAAKKAKAEKAEADKAAKAKADAEKPAKAEKPKKGDKAPAADAKAPETANA